MKLQDLFGKARKKARSHSDQIEKGLDKAEKAVSKKTGGKYDEKVRSAREKAEQTLTGDEQTGDKQTGDEQRSGSDQPQTGSEKSQTEGSESGSAGGSGDEGPPPGRTRPTR